MIFDINITKNVRKDKKFLFENLFSNKFDQFIIGVNYL